MHHLSCVNSLLSYSVVLSEFTADIILLKKSYEVIWEEQRHVCIAVFTLDAELLSRSQYPEGPATGHLDTSFSWFPCA